MKLMVISRPRKVLQMDLIEAHPRARFRIIFSKLSRSSNSKRIRWNWVQRFQGSQLPTLWEAWANQVKALKATPVRLSRWWLKQVNQVRLLLTAVKWWTAYRTCSRKIKLRCWARTRSKACPSKTCSSFKIKQFKTSIQSMVLHVGTVLVTQL